VFTHPVHFTVVQVAFGDQGILFGFRFFSLPLELVKADGAASEQVPT